VSIERVERARKGTVYRVRWRDDRGRKRSKSFDRKRDAEAFEAKVTLAKRRGELDDIDAGKQRLDDLLREYWRIEAEPRLAPKTLERYGNFRQHIEARLGHVELRKLTPQRLTRFQSDLLRDGVGAASVRKTMTFLQGVLQRAVEWRRLSTNPVLPVRKIANPRPRAVRPLSPASVEKVRTHLLAKGRLRDATLVAVLAYAGLRPGEALALTWGDIGVRTILVDKATSLGKLQSTKTGRTRSVVLLKPLAADLAEWRLAAGRPAADALVFPTRDGELWQRHHWQNWRRRIYAEAAEAVGINDPRPYDLRHSFCSLLLAEGKGPLEVAEQLGHSPLMTLQTYGHVIDELRGRKKVSAEAEIRKARESSVPQKAPNAAEGGASA
jgi:integrase